MNLRVELILDTERRSASLINVKTVIRISAIVVPLLIAAIAAMMAMDYMSVKQKRDILKSQREDQKPTEEKATTLNTQLGQNLALLKEIEGWQNARTSWSVLLLDLQKSAPDKIHFDTLTVQHALTLEAGKSLVRTYGMSLKGVAGGSNPEQDVRQMKEDVRLAASYTNLLDSVPEIKRFEPLASHTDETKHHRAFTLDLKLKPRKFE